MPRRTFSFRNYHSADSAESISQWLVESRHCRCYCYSRMIWFGRWLAVARLVRGWMVLRMSIRRMVKLAMRRLSRMPRRDYPSVRGRMRWRRKRGLDRRDVGGMRRTLRRRRRCFFRWRVIHLRAAMIILVLQLRRMATKIFCSTTKTTIAGSHGTTNGGGGVVGWLLSVVLPS